MISTKDMACHTWALSGNPVAGEQINKTYVSVMNKIGSDYQYGADLQGQELAAVRQKTMEKLSLICEQRKQHLDHKVYLCGGFRNEQVCPEHLWIEDHTTMRTYDTFINQDVRQINHVGVPGQPFQPGCEADPFQANEIARIRIDGYTDGQAQSISG